MNFIYGKGKVMGKSVFDVASAIREKIKNGTYRFGFPIPSERDLAETYQVSRTVIRNSLSLLTDEGLVKKIHGKGTYVTKTDIDDSVIHFKGMTELLKKAGYDPSSRILNTQVRKANYKFSKIFNVPPETDIFQILRLRLGSDRPISIENTYILYNSLKDIEKIDFQIFSLYDMFLINNIRIQDIRHVFSTTRVHNTEARFLETEDSTPVISIEITSLLADRSVAEYTEALVLPSFSKYYTDSIIKNGVYHINSQTF